MSDQDEITGFCERFCSTPPSRFVGDVPDFVGRDFYYGEISQEGMAEFLKQAEASSVATAIDNFLIPNFEEGHWLKDYIADNSRADWRFMLDENPEATVLDLGCGYGGVSIPLAEMFGTIISVDPTYERVKTLVLRARDLGIGNIVPMRADALNLPFKEGVLDGVVMMGVLEWIGEFAEGTVRDLQLKVLKDIHRAIKPGGFFVLGIENRFGYNYFLGEPDEHSHLRFTSLMPRWLADLISKYKSHKSYRTYTYSLRGLRRLLGEAGFSEVNFWGAIPKYRYPDFVIDFSHPEPLAYYISSLGKRTGLKRYGFPLVGLLHQWGIWKHLFPTFIVVGTK